MANNNCENNFNQFIFRDIRQDEAEQTAVIETVCFPPNEVCSREDMIKRVAAAPELFLVAEDINTGKIAGFLNGIAVNETAFRDEFFTDPSLHDPAGSSVMLMGLDVLPEYRHKGLATELVRVYCKREKEKGRARLVLTCLEEKIGFYSNMGFRDLGISASRWGGEAWHEMEYIL